MKLIPYSRQTIDSQDIKAVSDVLKTDWLTQGPKVKEFEEGLCRYTGARFAVCVSSGTAALHLSMLALGAGKGDIAVTSPITFSASANCALYAGARPCFVDINERDYHMDAQALEGLLKAAGNKKIKAVIPVHFMGTVAPLAQLKKICDKYGAALIEDAAHAIGAKYKSGNKWVKVGSCLHSDMTIFSFHSIKSITTGEGGAVLTNNKELYQRCMSLRQHGIVRCPNGLSINPVIPEKVYWAYDIPEVGFNYRITDIQCALGISQLKKLDSFISKKRKLVDVYNKGFSDLNPVQLPYERKDTFAAFHLYVIRVPADLRDKLHIYLRKRNVMTQVNYIPVHILSYYRKEFEYKWGDFPNAEKYFKECLSLPLYPQLTEKQQAMIIKLVRNFISNEL